MSMPPPSSLRIRTNVIFTTRLNSPVTDTIIITDVIPEYIIKNSPSQIIFRPALRHSKSYDGHGTWWYLPPETIVDFLGVLGFENTHITYHKQLWKKEENNYMELPFYTVIGKRK